MLRKRTRSVQKEVGETKIESQVRGNGHKSDSFFNIACLFWGSNPKNAPYNDSSKSPKSPLEETFSRSPGSPPRDVGNRSWNSGKVGLSIVDSLAADGSARERILLSSDSKNIAFGPKPKSETPNSDTDFSSSEATIPQPEILSFHHSRVKSPLHKGSSDVVFEIGGSPPDSAPFEKTRSRPTAACITPQLVERSPKSSSIFFPAVASKDGFVESLSADDIELSEDYTRVTCHGPNPKTTHIYGDCVLECHSSDELLSDFIRKVEEDMRRSPRAPASYPFAEFLSSCYACGKSLQEDKDIYIYREKAFCSVECRQQEISFDEANEETADGDEEGILKQVP